MHFRQSHWKKLVRGAINVYFQGSAVFWYNYLPDGSVDERMVHAACPVLLGSKWGNVVNKLLLCHAWKMYCVLSSFCYFTFFVLRFQIEQHFMAVLTRRWSMQHVQFSWGPNGVI